jgi:hypothetical protein
MSDNKQKQICGNCKQFQDPPFGYPMCKKLRCDTTKDSQPKKENCFEEK